MGSAAARGDGGGDGGGGGRLVGRSEMGHGRLQVMHGAFHGKAGSLSPALHRLEQAGWIEGEWQESTEGRRVRSYTLTRAGKRQLAVQRKTWTRIVRAMTALLESA